MKAFVITPPENVTMKLGDIIVEFYGDPPPSMFLALVRSKGAFSPTATLEEQIEVVATLVDRLRDLAVPQSLPAFDKLAGDGVLSTVVVMQMFAHLIDSYGESLGFQRGSSAPSQSGPPDTAVTYAE